MSSADPWMEKPECYFEVAIAEEDHRLPERYLRPVQADCRWISLAFSACADVLGRIAVIGRIYGNRYVLDIYSEQDGKSATVEFIYHSTVTSDGYAEKIFPWNFPNSPGNLCWHPGVGIH